MKDTGKMAVIQSSTFVNRYLRHGLVYGLYTIPHGKFINYFLSRFIKIYFPCLILKERIVQMIRMHKEIPIEHEHFTRRMSTATI